MIAKTKGIVLRSVKYGETSLVVSVYTELYGLQSYLVNGVRTAVKRGGAKAAFFQPASLLHLVVYHNEFSALHRIREFNWAVLYQHVLTDVIKNSVASFLIELVSKCVKVPEPNPELFYFVEDSLLHLDEASGHVAANLPLFFALHLPYFFGFRISDEYTEEQHYLDLHEGVFTPLQPGHHHYLQDREAEVVSYILKAQQPSDLEELHLNREFRRKLLNSLEQYYALHMPEFGSLKTLPVLRELMG